MCYNTAYQPREGHKCLCGRGNVVEVYKATVLPDGTKLGRDYGFCDTCLDNIAQAEHEIEAEMEAGFESALMWHLPEE